MNTSITTWLRLEGLSLLALSIVLYASFGSGWVFFAALLLIPDVAMLGYLVNPQIGALVYNVAHSYPLPACLLAFGLVSAPLLVSLGLIWFAHIGMDRLLGYGLKYPDGFKHTHLSNA